MQIPLLYIAYVQEYGVNYNINMSELVICYGYLFTIKFINSFS